MTAGAYDTDPHPRCQLTTPILIDTDPGIDDALAILLALGSPEVSVEAITTVAGNVGVDLGTANAFRILDAARPRHRPRVARGAAGPLVGPLITAVHFRVVGVNGSHQGGRRLGPIEAPTGDPATQSPRIPLRWRTGQI